MYTQSDKSDGSSLPTGAVLFSRAQGGCRESMNQLMGLHDGLVHAVVRRQVLGDLPYAEALQAGRIGLWRAIEGYDPDRGWAFSTYAWTCIVHHVWRAVKVHTRAAERERVTLQVQCVGEWCAAGCRDPEQVYSSSLVHRALHDLVARLPDRLRGIMHARYGLAGRRTFLYPEIGARLQLSGERVRQLHTQALVWLRHPAHSYTLRALLGRHRVRDYAWAETEAQRWLRKRGGRHGRS